MTDPTQHPTDAQLYDYVVGDLPAGERTPIDQHLSACAACRALVAEAVRGSEAVSDAPIELMPSTDADRMHSALAQEWDRRRTGRGAASSAGTKSRARTLRGPSGWAQLARRRGMGLGLAGGVAALLLTFVVIDLNSTSSMLDSSRDEVPTSSPTTGGDAGSAEKSTPPSGASEQESEQVAAPAPDSAARDATATSGGAGGGNESLTPATKSLTPNPPKHFYSSGPVPVPPVTCDLQLGQPSGARVGQLYRLDAGPISSVSWACGRFGDAPADEGVIPAGQPGN